MDEDKYKDFFICSTDTIIGIGAPVSEENFQLLLRLKKRPSTKKIAIAVSGIEMLKKQKNWNHNFNNLATKYFPGPFTLICNETAFRIVNCSKFLEKINEIGPCFLTSANMSGFPDTKTIEDAQKIFPQIKKIYDFCRPSMNPSTIIDLQKNTIKIRKLKIN